MVVLASVSRACKLAGKKKKSERGAGQPLVRGRGRDGIVGLLLGGTSEMSALVKIVGN